MGLRRGRSLLRRAPAAALLLGLTVAALPGCFGPSEEEETRLSLYRENSVNYYDRGEYLAALQQAGKALQIDPGLEPMQLVKGLCQLKLGQSQNNVTMIDESLATFEALRSRGVGPVDFRVNFGIGSANLARALEHDKEIDRIRRRLGSEFITEDGREEEEARLADEEEARALCLERAEKALRTVLADERQKDNTYVLLDLVLVLNCDPGREDGALELAERTLTLLQAESRQTQTNLTRNAKLSASAKIDLQQRVTNNDDKELALRDLIATIRLRHGDTTGFLEQMRLLEERGLIDEVQYWNLAEVHEQLGMYDEAIGDLESFLKLRARRMSYEQDDRAPEVFQRLEALRAKARAAAR
jgi:tetratricopeptide (TPR) repeat protein